MVKALPKVLDVICWSIRGFKLGLKPPTSLMLQSIAVSIICAYSFVYSFGRWKVVAEIAEGGSLADMQAFKWTVICTCLSYVISCITT